MRKWVPTICVVALAGLLWLLAVRKGQESIAPQPIPTIARSLPPAPLATSAIAAPPPQYAPVQPASAPPQAAPEPVAAFAQWLERYLTSIGAARAALLPEGETLARQRQASLYALIANDPAAALAASVNEAQRRLLPESIAALLERPISVKADLIVLTNETDSAHPEVPELSRQVQINGETLDAYVYGRRQGQQTKYATSVIGVAMQNRMAVLEEPARILSPQDLPAGAVLEAPLEDDATATAAKRSGTAAPVILQVAGRYYPVPSVEHAAQVAARWQAAEDAPGPILQASGASLPGAEAAATPSASSHTLGAQSVLVIVATFSDSPVRPVDVTTPLPFTSISSAYVSNQLTVNVANFYTQASYGKTTIGSVTVTDSLLLTGTLASYSTANNTADLKTAAFTAARAAGFTPENYDRVGVVFPNTHGITNDKFYWSGLAELGGSFTWFNGNFDLGIVAHELGHNYGLSHAKLWQIPALSTDPVDPNGTPLDYGDPFDIMGGAISDAATQPDPPNPWYLNNLGWLPDAAVQDITTDGTYRVYRFDHQQATLSNTLALRLNRNEGTDYWLAFRRKYLNHPSRGDMGNGAYVFWAMGGNPSSELIDIDTPGLSALDASLNTGSTFNDSAAGISLQVVDEGGTAPNEYLDVHVAFQSRIAFSHKVYNVDEQGGSVTLTVNRLNSKSGAVSAAYSTVPGTATAGSDYTTTSGTLVWADGDDTPRTIVVPIIADNVVEGPESFTVQFGASSGCVFPGGTSATVNIQEPGSADPLFVHPFLTSSVNAMALQPDGSLVIGGNFQNGSIPITSSGISRLTGTGVLDTSFDQGLGVGGVPTGALFAVAAVTRQVDGKILVGGTFTSIRGAARNRIARLLPSGYLDTSFDPGIGPGNTTAAGNVISSIVVQPDGKILVGGEFITWNGATRKTLVRLNEDGSLDSTFGHLESAVIFDAGYEAVNAVALQPCAAAPCFAIVVGGSFRRTATGNSFHSGIVRLNADGTRDTTFDALQGAHLAGATNNIRTVSSLAVQSDGKILAGGPFTGFNGVNVKGIVRLNSAGTNDSSFVSGVGAGFTNSEAYWDVVALSVQGDGRILAGGFFDQLNGVAKRSIARFNASGTPDSSFTATVESSSDNGVTSLIAAPDSSIFIGLNHYGTNPNVVKHLFTGQAGLSGVIQFANAGASVAEGGTAQVSVERAGGVAGKVSVNYCTVNRTAVAGSQFTLVCGTLTWNDGDASAQTISVPTHILGASDPDSVFEIDLGLPLGGASVGQRAVASVTIVGADISQLPQVNFAVASSGFTESVSQQHVTVQLSQDHADAIVVPFAVAKTSTAVVAKDYTLGTTSPLTFGPHVTSVDILVNLLEDTVVEPAKNLILNVLTPTAGSAVLGNTAQHTLVITDDDVPPTFTATPTGVVAAVGAASVTFTSAATGSPTPAYQWYKNKVKITGATAASYTLSNVQLTQAGQYSVTITNAYGSKTAIAELGVVDTTARAYNFNLAATATLPVVTAGNILTYTWTKGGSSALSGTRITASGKTLILKTLVANDGADYVCTVGQTGGATSVPVAVTLHVIDGQPVVTNTGKLTDGIVGGLYSYQITVDGQANHTPVTFTAVTLPAGLTCNALTGEISGRPTSSTLSAKSDSINITLKATNAFKGTALPVVLPLKIAPLAPNTVGAYLGPVDLEPTVNGNLGGRVDLNITATGAYSGTLTLGGTGYGFKGVLNATVGSPQSDIDVMVARTGKTTAQLTCTVDPANNRVINGTVTADGGTATFPDVWRNTWTTAAPATAYAGYQTFSVKIADADAVNPIIPQGLGYGAFTVPLTGTFNIAGVLADGAAYTSNSFLSTSGEMLVHQAPYTGGKGSIHGKLAATAGTQLLNADSAVTGSLAWVRPAIAGHTYVAGFSASDLTVDGGRYLAPKTTTMPPGFVAGTLNADVLFTGAGVADATPVPDLNFTIKLGGVLTVPVGLAKTTVTFTASNGAFSGGFTQITPAKRSGVYKGILVNHSGVTAGDGWFTLPQLLPTPTTSDVLSGKVHVQPH